MGLPPGLSRRIELGIDELVASELASAERPDAQTNLGNVYATLRRWQEAEDAFRRALSIDPTWIPAYINLSELQRALGAEATAEETLRRAIAAAPEAAEPYHALGLSLVRQRRYDEALQALATAWRTGPGNGQFGFVYAVALNSLGARPQAIAVLQEVVERHPSHRTALMSLAQLHRDEGDLNAARHPAKTAGIRTGRCRDQSPRRHGSRRDRALSCRSWPAWAFRQTGPSPRGQRRTGIDRRQEPLFERDHRTCRRTALSAA